MSILDRLTVEQQAIVAHREGPSIVLAVAGSGKTTTLLLRVQRLFDDRPLMSNDVLLTTFSRLGVADLRRRAGELGLRIVPEIRTLHSIAWRAIKTGGHAHWKLPPEWWVRKVVKDCYDKEVDKASGAAYPSDGEGGWSSVETQRAEFSLRDVMQLMGVAKANVVRLEAWTDSGGVLHPSFADWARETRVFPPLAVVTEACYRALEEARHAAVFSTKIKGFKPGDVACTHDDALAEVAYAILTGAPWVQPLIGAYKHVLVDEVQDNSLSQWILVRHLAKTFRSVSKAGVETTWQNLMVIGDDQQSIYGWRGARPDLLLDFMRTEGPQLSFFPLTMNFRSGKAILDVANRLLRSARKRLFSGELRCGRPEIDAKVTAHEALDVEGEAFAVADEIQESIKSGRKAHEIAVLYRMNSQAGLVELELIRRGIPYRVAGRGFFSRPEVDAAIKYIALAIDEADEESFETIYRLPTRWIRRDFLTEFPSLAALRAQPKGLVSARWKGATRLLRDMDNLIVRLRNDGLVAALEYVFDEIGVRKHCKREADDDELEDDDGSSSDRGSEVDAAIAELLACAKVAGDPVKFLEYVRDRREEIAVADPDGEKEDERVTLSTVHRCVDEKTLVETPDGLLQVRDLKSSGQIGTASGAMKYDRLVRYPTADMLRVTTKSGYSVVVTMNHGMMAWTGGSYERVEASELKVGQFLRLVLGAKCDATSAALLPDSPPTDVRSVIYRLPKKVTEDVAEFFGLMVGDGTLYRGGFRVSKRHPEVVDRFRELCETIFGARVKTTKKPLRTPYRGLGGESIHFGEVSSTFIADWLRSIGGMSPWQKYVPDVVMRSPLSIQARFLRGLLEDGTVNVKNGQLDHLDWSNRDPGVVATVQTMLLRFGIVSSMRPVRVPGRKRPHWHLYVYGSHAKRLRQKIGLITKIKMDRLSAPVGHEDMYSIPVSHQAATAIDRRRFPWARQNAMQRGFLSRHTLREIGGFDEELSFFHERITSIEKCSGTPMCIRVPGEGRFVQNGFDGCNSKGLEWDEVHLIGATCGMFPAKGAMTEEERRLAYVATSRPRRVLHVSWVETPSVLVYDAGLADRPLRKDGSLDDLVRLEIR